MFLAVLLRLIYIVLSIILWAIGGYYLLSSIWELSSRYGWGGFGCVIPRHRSLPGGFISRDCP